LDKRRKNREMQTGNHQILTLDGTSPILHYEQSAVCE